MIIFFVGKCFSLNNYYKYLFATFFCIHNTPIVISFARFLPLFTDIKNIFEEIIDITQTAEHNGRICDMLLQRVYAVNLAVIDLKIARESNQRFFNINNYLVLQNLISIINLIKKFITNISQMKNLINYIQAKNIEESFNYLCENFDHCVRVLSFSIQ